MNRLPRLVALPVLVALVCAGPAPAPGPAERPVPRTHAHNDYLHPRPLLDALSHGFVGVEADVFLVGTDLRVSHNAVPDWTKVPTLQDAYLKPLADQAKRHKSRGVYADGTRLLLLVDIKTEAVATYRRLHEMLAEFQSAHPGLFTRYRKADATSRYDVAPGAVDVVISGNRPRAFMAAQDERYAGYDGRLADVGPDARPDDAPEFVPLVSDNWNTVFTGDARWNGAGPVPAATKAKLEKLVADVHAEGKRLRFWNLPKDGPNVWGPLYDAGVDLINTDDLAGLAKYVRQRDAD
jgi:hypothetical protein